MILVKLFTRNAVVAKFTTDFRADTCTTGSEVEPHVVVAIFVTCGAEGELMVIAGHTEVITYGLVMISLAIAVGVTQAR